MLSTFTLVVTIHTRLISVWSRSDFGQHMESCIDVNIIINVMLTDIDGHLLQIQILI